MSNRFHNKWHRVSHHTYKDPNIIDAGWDPIASHENPFKGDFVIDGGSIGGSLFSKDLHTIHLYPGNNTVDWYTDTITAYSNFVVTGNETVGGNTSGHGWIKTDSYLYSLGANDEGYGLVVDKKATVGGQTVLNDKTYVTKNGLFVTGDSEFKDDLTIDQQITVKGPNNNYISGGVRVGKSISASDYIKTATDVSARDIYATNNIYVGNDLDVNNTLTAYDIVVKHHLSAVSATIHHVDITASEGKGFIVTGYAPGEEVPLDYFEIPSQPVIGGVRNVYLDKTGLYVDGWAMFKGETQFERQLILQTSGHDNVGSDWRNGAPTTVFETDAIINYPPGGGENVLNFPFDSGTVARLEDMGPEFDSTKSYVPGEFVTYNRKLYRCVLQHFGSWNGSHFIETTIDDSLLWHPGSGMDSAVQRQTETFGIITGGETLNSSVSQSSTVEGGSNMAGLKGYRYVNAVGTAITNQLMFDAVPAGWAAEDVVSVINDSKYLDAGTIQSIDTDPNTGKFVVTFKANLNVGGTVKADDGWDARCAYVSAKPDKGDIDLGYGAHVEGVGSKALNVAAHAEGRETRALGQYSHAEGRNTSAKNYIAHAEGHDTVAKGMTSHAEGYSTKANGDNSHSEGREAETFGANSHAENYNTSASGENSHAEGAQSRTGGTDKPDPVTVFTNTGYAAHAEGNGTWATGSSSHAEGYSTVASALAAHAEGNQTVASGMNSHASGLKSVAEGYASTAMGRSAHAQHDRSFVWQGRDTDIQYHSHSIGSININPAPEAGSTDPNTGIWIGEKTLAQLLAEKADDANVVHKTGDTMTGGLTVPNLTVGSRMEGSTVGVSSVAEGEATTSSGLASHAEGYKTTASGTASHAEGNFTTASGDYSHAEGFRTETQNNYEHAEGVFNASHKAGATFGNSGNTLHSIGIGSGDSTRKNAVEVMQDGKVYISGVGDYNGTNPGGNSDLATVISRKAPINSPEFTGTPTAPTPTSGDNTTKVATTKFVSTAVSTHNTASDAHAALFATRPTMISIGDGVWVFVDGGDGFVVINGEAIILPASKTSFGMSEYYDNDNLSIVYAPSVVTVGNGAFSSCSSLTTISLPAATDIAGTVPGGAVFSGCSALKTVSLPSAIDISEDTFVGCSSLATIDLSSLTINEVRANASYWGIAPSSGHTITITCSDGEYIIEE